MRINNLKVNQYGKLENKEISMDKINIIYGKNEAGKSTLLSFIQSMFYGISKNKNKKDFSDYEQYKPWKKGEFSGNINYTLDDGKKIYVFRDFEKKNPKIYDENNNDISDYFSIDKKEGNCFFTEQTGVTKDVIKSTVIAEQNSIEIDASTQNILLQKIINISETGEEETSYKKAKAKLDKMFLEEVGTERSVGRPINKVKDNLKNYSQEISEIKLYEDNKYYLQNRQNELEKELNEEIGNREIYEQVKKAIEDDEKEREKIKIKNKIVEENNEKIERLNNYKEQYTKNKNKEKKKISLIVLLILIMLNIISLIVIKNRVVNMLLILLIPAYIISMLNTKKSENENLENEIKLLEENNNGLKTEVNKMKEELLARNEKTKDFLVSKYGKNINELFNREIYQIIDDNKDNINSLKLELHKIELDKENIEPKLEQLIELEEKIDIEQRRLKELEQRKKIYEITNQVMEKSYEEMKNSIVPKFTKELNENVKTFSNNKYSDVVIKDEIMIKLDNGEYIPIERLSLGTIEEIYLALRLSMINVISNEKMPIILDEAFAYFDDNRLANTLNFLSKIENQVIILTCTNREYEILKNNNIPFNFIELTT